MALVKIISSLFLITSFKICFIDAFHPDYSYIEATHSFYKLHRESTKWTVARETCRSEGGILFHPQSDAELGMVLSVLDVGDNNVDDWIHTGLSDLGELTKYVTVDGRPVNQVHNKWYSGQPDSANGVRRCIVLNIKSHELFVNPCDYTFRYICKILSTESVVTAIQEIKSFIANSSDKQTTILERLAEAAAKQAAALERLTTNQAAAFERMAAAGENQAAVLQTLTDTMKSQIANQTAALEHIAVAGANEAASLERIAETGANEAAAIKLIAVAGANDSAAVDRMLQNQTAIMERQALALEKLVSLQEESDPIDVRSRQ